MKHLNFLSKSSSQSCDHSSVTLASTVGSPSVHRRGTMLKLISVLVLILTFGVGDAWGDTTKSSTSFSTLSGNIGNDANISYSTGNGSATTATAIDGTSIKLYRSTGNNAGGILLLTANNGVKIKSFKITFTGALGYRSASNTTAAAKTNYTSLTSATAVTNLDLSSVQIGNITTGKTQAFISAIEVTYSSGASYTITAQSNNTSWGTVSGTSTITASPKAGYRVCTSSPYSVSPANSATVSQNGNTFTVTPSANTTVTINFEVIPTHKISFNTGGLTTIGDATGIQEGAVYNITQTPAASLTPSCEYGTFVGWTTASSIANASICPSIVTSVTMSTSDVTLNAVYSKTTGGGGNNGSIELTTETENFPTAYGTANKFTEYTLEGKKFKIQQGYVNGTKLQWRASGNSNGTGIIYNTEVFPAKITSVVLVYDNSDNNKNFTLNVSNTENPTSGTAITPSSEGNTYTFDCSEENADYFVLANGSGAGYLTSITINYGNSGTTTYSLDANCCTELAQINGSINLSHF